MADKYGSLYDHIVSYQITAICKEPLHIGGNDDRAGGILIHPVKNVPFIQATGLAGAMRDYLADEPGLQNQLFGSSADGTDTGSKVRISDAFFAGNVVDTELRPRVKINRETGTCQTVQTKGGQNWSGQKFEMESVAAGSEFTFKMYLYERNHEHEATIERILGALQAGNIQIGGQKSNGCGYVEFKELMKTDYDMTREKDRKLWRDESKEGQSILEELKGRVSTLDHRIHFELKGKVDSEILVKSIDVRDYNEESADAEQMRRADGELLIPATSIKGVLRSQMEKIAKLRQLPVSDIEAVFGKNAEKEEKGYSLGWLHHKGRNKHHWEYWLDFGVDGIYACKMPTNYVIEMFCDRVAASMIYQKENYTDSSALEYYENGRGKILIHPETDALIHHLLKYLSEYGLDQTIHYIVAEIKE